jgi:cytochrome c-type biogenesis protein CcmF
VRLRWALAISLVAALLLPLVMGRWSALIATGLWLAFWVIAATVLMVVQRLKGAPQPTLAAKVRAQSLSWYGMTLAHLGVAIFILGVTLVKGYETERDLRMSPGEHVEVGGYDFTFRGTHQVPGPNYNAIRGEFEVRRAGSPTILMMLEPEKRQFRASGMVMTEAAIDSGIARDLYVSLGEPVENGAWGVRVYHKPFVDWIWGGCFVMAIGGFLALCDRRYRSRRALAPAPDAARAVRA